MLHIEDYLTALKNKAQYRTLSPFLHKENNIDFSHNDYFALSQNKHVLEAGIKAAELWGVGSTGSRLLSGNKPCFQALEETIAKDKGYEACLIFSSGFQANYTTLKTLLAAALYPHPPFVFFDRLNHASLYEAVQASAAQLIRYHHCDLNHLSHLLKKHQDTPNPKFIITESLFGMDGDIAPLQEIAQLSQKYNAFLYIDDAHATGLYLHHTKADILMGTFSKALGLQGAYICCTQRVKEYLINRAPGFIYSTAPSPFIIGAAHYAWALLKTYHTQRTNLFDKAVITKNKLQALGFHCGTSTTPIIPIMIKDLSLKDKLLAQNIHVSLIRPPTVPPKTERLRIALNITHTQKDIDYFIEALKAC